MLNQKSTAPFRSTPPTPPAAIVVNNGNSAANSAGKNEKKRQDPCLLALALPILLLSGVSSAQYAIMDQLADKVVQHYRQTSCEQLWQQRGQPRSQREQEAIQILRQNHRCARPS